MECQDILLYVGSYCEKEREGITVCRLDWEHGVINKLSGVKGVENPTYLTVSKDGENLYAISEVADYLGGDCGAAAAFAIGEDPEHPRLLNMMSTGGKGPCHVLVDARKEFLFAANYGDGSVSMMELDRGSGVLKALLDCKRHEGSGPNASRQEAPHVHSVAFAEQERFLMCADLGIDTIKCYEIDRVRGRLNDCPERDIRMPDGSGVRHFVFHPGNASVLYAVCELSSEVAVMLLGRSGGQLIQRISVLQEEREGNLSAAVRISPDGKFLYVSNRGEDSIAVFLIDQETYQLRKIQTVPTGGRAPRDFYIAGDIAVVANQDTDDIFTYRIDRVTGCLSPEEGKMTVTKPVCVTGASNERGW